jgi:murein DD-endopeptidase MepM/ murein hydrolase activator NlpD
MNIYQPVDCGRLVVTQGFLQGVHNGLDLRSVDFTTWKKYDILATEDCVVERISTIDGTDGYGNDYIVLRPSSGIQDICDLIKYIHLHFAGDFEKGQELEAGTVLGVTAIISEYKPPRSNSTKHHLHWETWKDNKAFSPVEYLTHYGIKLY